MNTTMQKFKIIVHACMVILFCLTILTSCSYLPSQGSNSPDGMKAGIKVNGKYYEGVEYKHYWLWCGPGETYSELCDNAYFPHNIKTLPEGCPVIQLSKNDTYVLFSDYKIQYHYFIDFSSSASYRQEYSELPSTPGMYLLVAVSEDVRGFPWFDENFVWPEEQTEYVLSYQYIFAVKVK